MFNEGPGKGSGGGSEGGINIKRLIRLRLPVMILIAAVIALPALALVWTMVPVEWKATAYIQYDVNAPTVTSAAPSALKGPQLQRFMNDQVLLIKGSDVLSKAQQSDGVKNIPWIVEAGSDLDPLRDTISASLVPGSNVIDVTCTTDTREHALAIVTAVRYEYLGEAGARESGKDFVRLTALRDSKAEKERELDRQQSALLTLQRSIDAPLDDGVLRTDTQMNSYHVSSTAAKTEISRLSASKTTLETQLERLVAYKDAMKTDPSAPIFFLDIENEVLAEASILLIKGRLNTQEYDVVMLEEKYNANAPQLIVARKTLTTIRNNLAAAEQRVRRERLEAKIAALNDQLESESFLLIAAEEQYAEFKKLIEENLEEDIDLSRERLDIADMKQKVDDLRKDIARVAGNIDNIQLNSQAPARVGRTGIPEAPLSPSHSKRLQISLLICFVAGALGAGYGLGREFTDQSLRTPQDVGFVTGLPILAAIPHAKEDRLPDGVDAPLLTADHPDSTTADEFRRILTRIIYPPEGSAELNTCLIVSPSRGDGKTSLAANLAISLAQANRRVLLVDISSRHPSVEKCFGLDPTPGLSELLMGDGTPGELVRETHCANLSVLGPGFRGKDLVGKLASRETVEFLEQAEEAFEHVIIDTPPALLMSDAKLLAPIVDGVLVVCGAGVSSSGMLRRCISELQGIGANTIGVVLNAIRPHRGGYLRKNLQLYYKYSDGRDESGPVNGSAKGSMPAVQLLTESDGSAAEEEAPMIVLVDDDEPAGLDAESDDAEA
jgi:capsular exopolysaccharide synthesis family protein